MITQEEQWSISRHRFAGKVVLVTGAASGLGAVLARKFAEEAATVVLADVACDRGEAVAASLRSSGARAIFLQLDVTSPGAWTSAVRQIRSECGALQVLVNNAGVISRTRIRDVPLDEWHRVIDINLTGPVMGIQAVAPLIRDSGGGAIVNIGSTSGIIGHPGVAYSASKWGLRAVARSAALDLLEWGIRVNSVHPAQVSGTQITAGAGAGYRNASDRAMPAKRAVSPDEVANSVLFLASDEASYINATDLVVDGGAVSIGLPRIRRLLEEDLNTHSANAADS